MKCIKCGKDLADGAKFCPFCGERVINLAPPPAPAEQPVPAAPKFCPTCGTELAPENKFCPGCGASVAAAAGAAVAAAAAATAAVVSAVSDAPGVTDVTNVAVDQPAPAETPEVQKAPGPEPAPAPEPEPAPEPPKPVEPPKPAEPAVPATKFCPYCGTPLAKGINFCPKCGKPADLKVPDNKGNVPSNAAANAGAKPAGTGKKIDKKWFIIGGCALAAIILAVLLIVILGGGVGKNGASSPEALAESMIDYMDSNNYEGIAGLLCDPSLREIGNFDVGTSRNEMIKVLASELRDKERDYFGRQYGFRAKYKSAEVTAGLECPAYALEYFTAEERASVEDFAKVTVKYEISGYGQSEAGSETVYCIKMNGKWFLFDIH